VKQVTGDWYVIQCISTREKKAVWELKKIGVLAFTIQEEKVYFRSRHAQKKTVKLRPVLGGLLFARVEPSTRLDRIKACDHVYDLYRAGEAKQIQRFFDWCASVGLIFPDWVNVDSSSRLVQPFYAGDETEITYGPFEGFKIKITRVGDYDQVSGLVNIFGGDTPVQVRIDWLAEPVLVLMGS